MAEAMNVDPELLVASGAVLDEHSQSVFATHSAADQTIESSLFSWVGQSQTASAAKAAAWTTVTTRLTARLYEHAEGLRTRHQRTRGAGRPGVTLTWFHEHPGAWGRRPRLARRSA